MRERNPYPHFTRVFTWGVALLLCAAGAQAAGTPIPHGTLELMPETQWIEAGHEFYLGLNFQLEKGWHVYWVNPGDSGEPPRVTWQLPPGITAGAIQWPTPRRLGTSTIVDYGYQDAVMLLVPMRAATNLAAQQPAQIGAEARVLVCREICIPGKAQLSLTLAIKSQPPAPDALTKDLFTATRKSLPRPAPGNWKFSVEGAKDSFTLAANLGQQVGQATFFPLDEAQIDNSAPQKFVPVTTGFRLTLQKSDELLKPIERLKGVLVLSGDQGYSIDAPLSKPGAAGNGTGDGINMVVESVKEGPNR